jgi:hypothetical protein
LEIAIGFLRLAGSRKNGLRSWRDPDDSRILLELHLRETAQWRRLADALSGPAGPSARTPAFNPVGQFDVADLHLPEAAHGDPKVLVAASASPSTGSGP